VAAFVAAHAAHAAAAASTPQSDAASIPQRDDIAASTPQRDAPAEVTGEERAEEAARARALAAACEALLEVP
jgi:hypothetical protein